MQFRIYLTDIWCSPVMLLSCQRSQLILAQFTDELLSGADKDASGYIQMPFLSGK
ncbi:hypothetical protein [Salmonella enterica]|uniref:hypothetical protein n=1 Tax=Salmonella enterica TaxID=28901 RepID=UPI00140CF3F0|nr:hypothetical protein [Salmonella enterica]